MKTPEEFLQENGFVLAADLDRQAMIATFLSEMEKGLKDRGLDEYMTIYQTAYDRYISN